MRSRTCALAVTCLAAAALVVLPAGGATAARAGEFQRCGKIDLGYTQGKIKARSMSCGGAKGIFNKWERKVACPDKPCERTRVENFVCRFGGSEVKLRLSCAHRENDKALKATWGG